MQNLKQGYTRYYGPKGLMAARIGNMQQRLHYHDRAQSAGATCFFLSLTMIAPDPFFLEMFLRAHYILRDGYLRHFTYGQAIQACIANNLEIGVAIISLDRNERLSVVRQWWHPNSNGHDGLALVIMDDNGQIKPHWLPFTSLADNLWVTITEEERQRFSQYNSFLAQQALRIVHHPVAPVEVDHLFRQAFPNYLDWKPIDFNAFAAQPITVDPADVHFIGPQLEGDVNPDGVVFIGPLPQDVAENFDLDPDQLFDENRPGFVGPVRRPIQNFRGFVEPAEMHPLHGITHVVGVTPPPSPPGFSEFHFVAEPGYDLNYGDFGGFSEGPPSFWTKLFDFFTEDNYAWQCRPAMIQHMRLIDGDFVYFHMEPISLSNPRILVSGDYNPDFISGIMTDGGLFVLNFVVELVSLAGRFSFYRVSPRFNNTVGHLSGTNFVGALIDLVPYLRYSGENVLFTSSRQIAFHHAHNFLPDFSAYPDRRSVLKTWCSSIAQALPEEHKGKFLSVRNDALALMDLDMLVLHGDPVDYPPRADGKVRSKFNPFSVARDIISLSTVSRSMFVDLELRVAGAALSSE